MTIFENIFSLFQCQICSNSYRHNASLKNHILVAHQGEKKHKCEPCGATYFHFKGLKKHFLVKHGQRIRKVKDGFVEVDGESYARARIDKDRRMVQEKGGRSQEEAGLGQKEARIGHEAEMGQEEGRMCHEEDQVGHGQY